MKLGVVGALFANKSLKETLDYLKSLDVQMIEICTGGYPGKSHGDPEELLKDDAKFNEFKKTIDESGIKISAFACHGNPVHPNKEIAAGFCKDFNNTVLLAEKMGVETIVTFSGCPGGSPADMTPNWVTCPWPDDFLGILDYQWNEVLVPYWKETVKFAEAHGVKKIALEMHPGFCVYNPETLLKLRKAVGSDVIGANFDPSHLFWQGIDPVAAIRVLGKAIHYVHAKDTKVDAINTAKNGVLDTKHYGDEINRAWIFRSVGYGHDMATWKDIVSNLKLVGYDYVLSIEHEDSLMSPTEGFEKAVKLLKDALIYESAGEIWWA